jgi:hypothetical protein
MRGYANDKETLPRIAEHGWFAGDALDGDVVDIRHS